MKSESELKNLECHICSGYCSDYEEKKVITIKKGSFFSREVIEVRICNWCGEGLEKFGFDNKFVHLIIKEKDLINNKDAVIKHRNLLEKKLDAELKKWEKEEAREEKRIKDTKKKIINLLKKQKSKMPASDIDAHLKHQDVDEIKELCEEMYHDGKISRTGNYRYFVLTK